MKKAIIIVIILLVIGFLLPNSEASTRVYQTISTEDVYDKINNKTYKIIDVRSIAEYSQGHIENSINISLSNINKIEEYLKDKDTKIIVYCNSGSRSKEAAEQLLSLGYNNVYDMGGINNWEYELVK